MGKGLLIPNGIDYLDPYLGSVSYFVSHRLLPKISIAERGSRLNGRFRVAAGASIL